MRQETIQHCFRQWLVAWPAPSHYLNQCWDVVNWTLRNKLQWNFHRNSYLFIQENAFENVVWKMTAIFSRPQCVNSLWPSNATWCCRSGPITCMRIESLTHWGRGEMDVISQTIFSSAFSWMKMFEFRLKFHQSLFLRVQFIIFQHWFR